jgi:hypothetical protein
VISLLQLATRAGIPRQSEIRNDYWVASSSLHSLLSLVMSIIGTPERPRLRSPSSPGSDGTTVMKVVLMTLRCQVDLPQSHFPATRWSAQRALIVKLRGIERDQFGKT